jgi:hypothetical protein
MFWRKLPNLLKLAINQSVGRPLKQVDIQSVVYKPDVNVKNAERYPDYMFYVATFSGFTVLDLVDMQAGFLLILLGTDTKSLFF